MHRVIFSSLGLVFILFISGCDSSHSHLTDYSLCKKIATLPSYNIHKEAREKEVRSRGLSCQKFSSRIDKESAAERLAKARSPKIYNTYESLDNSDYKIEKVDNIYDDYKIKRMERNAKRQCRDNGGRWSINSKRCR